MNRALATSILSSPRPSMIFRPGIRSLAPGVERYLVRGGGSVTVRVGPGDRLRIVDLEGLQACEIVPRGTDGRADAAMLGGNPGAKQIRIFGEGPAGEAAAFTVQREGIVKVSAPGGEMDVQRQDTATDLELFITRAVPARNKSGDQPLPDPLADILQDIRVPAADSKGLHGQGRRIHPGHRRVRPAVYGLPVLLGAQARQGSGECARCHRHPHA